MNEIIIDEVVYKRYDDMYFVSASGDVYSQYSGKKLKHSIDIDGYHRVDLHSRHKKVHKLVYEVWGGELLAGIQVNHRDDNKDNNHISNLYAGTQKENIRDCGANGHRVGNTWYLTIADKQTGETLTFSPASDFIKYCGHPCENGNVKRMFSRNWFRKRYEIIDYKKKSVTTTADECRQVGQSLSLPEARRPQNAG